MKYEFLNGYAGATFVGVVSTKYHDFLIFLHNGKRIVYHTTGELEYTDGGSFPYGRFLTQEDYKENILDDDAGLGILEFLDKLFNNNIP